MFVQRKIRARRGEQGYVLLTLLLIMALMAIAAAMIVSSVTFEVRRDKEEEMVHRGVQYERAIRAYYRKFNRYPAKLEDLENSNQMRFLRKRYKDPLTGKDFKILHYGEAKMSMNALGGGIAGANAIGQNGMLNSPGGLGQMSSLGGGNNPYGPGTNSAFGQNAQASQQAGAASTTDSSQPGTQGSTDNSTPSSSSSSTSSSSGAGFGAAGATGGDKLAGTNFGGMPIVGVASLSKDTSIREYDKKKKYNEWQFVYDPTFDRGQLITTPYQPSLQQALAMQGITNVNGQNASGQNGSGFSNSPSPMQNNPTSPSGGFGNSSPSSPQSSPQQQQQ